MLAIRDKTNSAKRRLPRTHAGFTIIEILVGLVVAAIVLGLALPSLRELSANNQVVSGSHTIISGLNFARFNAITSGDDTTICPSEDGVSCSNDHWNESWIVFQDANEDGVADAAEVLKTTVLDSSIATSGFGQPIVFRSNGVTTLGSNAVISSCYAHSGVTSKCINITVNAFGAIQSVEQTVATETSG